MGAKDGGDLVPQSPLFDRIVVVVTLLVSGYLLVRALW